MSLNGLLILSIAGLAVFKPDYANYALASLIFTALPEEWFFRAYFLSRLESIIRQPLYANLLTSCLFALLHIPTQGWFGLAVFFPSLLYGWLYQQNRDLILVILLHCLSNLVFVLFIRPGLF
ncbi:MAG: CPBP family glutamic-type intramembrane protease [Gammaproteobacteria bacterium]|nr:CPBP family glutamic-type intramembrane protease [Gammaproteobacteria bacterium]